MRRYLLSLLLFACAAAQAGSVGAVPNVTYQQLSDVGCNQCVTGKTGTMLIRGFATMNGYNDFSNGNAFDTLIAPDLVTGTAQWLFSTSNGSSHSNIGAAIFPKAVKMSVDLKYNPIALVRFPVLNETDCHHIYLSHNNTLAAIDPDAFPVLVTMTGALVFSGDSALVSADNGLQKLKHVNHQLELDYTALPGFANSSIQDTGGTAPLCNGNPGSADMGALLFSGIGNGFTYIRLPNYTTWNGIILADQDGITNDLDFHSVNVIGPNAGLNLSHNKLDVATVNSLLVMFNTYRGSSTCTVGSFTPCLDLRFQTPAAAPTGAGAAAKAAMNAAGFAAQTD